MLAGFDSAIVVSKARWKQIPRCKKGILEARFLKHGSFLHDLSHDAPQPSVSLDWEDAQSVYY